MIAVAATLMEVLRSSFFGNPHNWVKDFYFSFFAWNSWALTVPIAVWLANSHLNFQKKLCKSIIIILIAATIVVIIKSLAFEYLFNLRRPDWHKINSFQELLVRSVFTPRLFVEYLIFGFIVTLIFLLQYFHILREREIHSSQLETQLAQSHLNSLKMQLQPHFLFNTLNSISSLLREQTDQEQLVSNMRAADRMITNLSEMFRYTLKAHELHEAPLHDEFIFLDNYLEIQMIRFANRLRVEKQIDSNLNAALAPTFLLQPVVENAIRHGISKSADSGLVQIHACRDGADIEFIVQDSGSCSKDELLSQEGVGISNTRKRLEYLYGNAFTFELNKTDHNQTEIKIRIPYHTKPIQTQRTL